MEEEPICLAKGGTNICIMPNIKKEILKNKFKFDNNIVDDTRELKINGERWKYIPGFCNKYMISHKGRVWSKKQGGRILKLYQYGDHHFVKLNNLSSGTTLNVARLVAAAFIGEWKKGMSIIHKDGDIKNNHYKNLLVAKKNQHVFVKKIRNPVVSVKIGRSVSIVDRKMKNGSIKRYDYLYYSVNFKCPEHKTKCRIFNTWERAHKFYLKKLEEYKQEYPDAKVIDS